MEFLIKTEGLLAVTYEENLEKVILYYNDDEVTINNVSENDFYKIERIFNNIEKIKTESLKDNNCREHLPTIGLKFYNKSLRSCFQVVGSTYLKCLDSIPKNYKGYSYINKETHDRYECCGWNYKEICLYVYENIPHIVVKLEDLLDKFWVVEK